MRARSATRSPECTTSPRSLPPLPHGISNSGIAAGGIEQGPARPSLPVRMASATMWRRTVFTDPPGLTHSALAITSTPSELRVMRWKRNSGVLPIRWSRLWPKTSEWESENRYDFAGRLVHGCYSMTRRAIGF